jgi:hypothetical protein
MDDAVGVSVLERVGQLPAETAHALRVEAPATEHPIQRLAVDQLHGEKGDAVGLTHLVYGADMGMAQRRRGPRLLDQPPRGVRVRSGVHVQQLERHGALKPRVVRPIHRPHAARADGCEDFVRTEPGTRGQAHAVARIIRSVEADCPGPATMESDRLPPGAGFRR